MVGFDTLPAKEVLPMALISLLVGMALATGSLSADSMSYSFESESDRRWPGADWYVNRVQDW